MHCHCWSLNTVHSEVIFKEDSEACQEDTVIIYSDTVLLVNIEQCLQMLIKICGLNINQKTIKVIIINKISELSITVQKSTCWGYNV